MSNKEFIPLLAPKPLDEYTAEEFKAYVIGMYFKREKSKAPKKPQEPFTFRLNAKGTLCLRINRNPKWLTHKEIESIAKSIERPSEYVYKRVVKGKIEIRSEGEASGDDNTTLRHEPEGTVL